MRLCVGTRVTVVGCTMYPCGAGGWVGAALACLVLSTDMAQAGSPDSSSCLAAAAAVVPCPLRTPAQQIQASHRQAPVCEHATPVDVLACSAGPDVDGEHQAGVTAAARPHGESCCCCCKTTWSELRAMGGGPKPCERTCTCWA